MLTASAGEPADAGFSPAEILKKVQENYATLISYSDEGCVLAQDNNVIISFTTRLAQTNFYLIEWREVGKSSGLAMDAPAQAVWSSGAGDHLQAAGIMRPQFNRQIALLNADIFSDRATATVPSIFFNIQDTEWTAPPDDLALEANRAPDEKLGDMNCYVLTTRSLGRTDTLWIGRRDFLIHQVRTIFPPAAVRYATQATSYSWPPRPLLVFTETHTNIVLNRKFTRSDFIPAIPLLPPGNE